MALQAAVADTLSCMNLDPTRQLQQATSTAQAAAQQMLNSGDTESRAALFAAQ